MTSWVLIIGNTNAIIHPLPIKITCLLFLPKVLLQRRYWVSVLSSRAVKYSTCDRDVQKLNNVRKRFFDATEPSSRQLRRSKMDQHFLVLAALTDQQHALSSPRHNRARSRLRPVKHQRRWGLDALTPQDVTTA